MNRTSKFAAFLIALALVAAFFIAPTAAHAQSGSGTVTATGGGRAEVSGSGEVSITGNGTLSVYDRAGDATISISGNGRKTTREYRNGAKLITYSGYDGTATVSGTNIQVILTGTKIDLSATGTGIVRLRGKGSYTLNGAAGEWTNNGIVLTLG
jgi:hypothetical protein